jgi:hypothetical protein
LIGESNKISELSEFDSNNDQRPGNPEIRQISKVSANLEQNETIGSNTSNK